MNGKLHASVGVTKGDGHTLNPFVHRLELFTTYDKFKTGFLTVAVLPFRVLAIFLLLVTAWVLACIGLWGVSEEDLRTKPITGWRRDLKAVILVVLRALFVFASFHSVKVTGKRASCKQAPVLAVGPHSSYMDALPIVVLGGPSIVAKGETGAMPLCGKLINYTQPVYVWRDDPNSRSNTIKEIIDRATSKEDWPQVLIFPEGTCTNRSCLITFKCGAFYPGVPVQPVCIKYPNKVDTVTWTWEGPGALKLLWLTLTQINSSCEIEFLPVYIPSEEEKINPKLYASNVRQVMAKKVETSSRLSSDGNQTWRRCGIWTRYNELGTPFTASSAFQLCKSSGNVTSDLQELERKPPATKTLSLSLTGVRSQRSLPRSLLLPAQTSGLQPVLHHLLTCSTVRVTKHRPPRISQCLLTAQLTSSTPALQGTPQPALRVFRHFWLLDLLSLFNSTFGPLSLRCNLCTTCYSLPSCQTWVCNITEHRTTPTMKFM